MTESHNQPRFLLLVTLLVCFFLTLQVGYVLRLPLDMDEFQGASDVDRLADRVPYQDFRPYKTVLGYYIQMPVLVLRSSLWQGLMNVKIQMAIFSAAALFFTSLRLRTHFRGPAVILGLGLTVAMTTFLERGADLRVDTLTALFGLLSLLLLMERRFVWAGALCALSFLVSQKAIYFIAASNAALGVYWLFARRDRETFKSLIAFNVAALTTLLAYLSFWSIVAGPRAVIDATFFSHGQIALGADYDIQLRYWIQTLSRNPLFYGLGALAFWRLEQRRKQQGAGYLEVLLLVYGIVLVALCAWHKQPWPYFFVILIPTVFVLVVYFFHTELKMRQLSGGRLLWPAIAAYGLLGIAYPLTRVPVNLARDSGFQRDMVVLADQILDNDDSYLAAVGILYDRPQGVSELAWIDRPRYVALHQKQPRELEAIRRKLDEAPLKLIIDNHRIQNFPGSLREHLGRNFRHLWGNIIIYSPIVEPEAESVVLKFGGLYTVESPEPQSLVIDGRRLESGESLQLTAGVHTVAAETIFLLSFIPEGIDDLLDPEYQQPRAFFPNVYDY